MDLERQRDEAMRTVAMIKAAGGDAIFVPTDVTDRQQIDQAFAEAAAKYGSVDISCSVVGGGPAGARAAILETSPEQYLATVEMTQHSTWHHQQVRPRHGARLARGRTAIESRQHKGR